MKTLTSFLSETQVQWSSDITGNDNDGKIRVYGADSKAQAIIYARRFFAEELPHLTASINMADGIDASGEYCFVSNLPVEYYHVYVSHVG